MTEHRTSKAEYRTADGGRTRRSTHARRQPDTHRAGFTLAEVMVAGSIMLMVIGGSLSMYVLLQRVWAGTSLHMVATGKACGALEKMVYGAGTEDGLREASASAMRAVVSSNGWLLTYGATTNFALRYRADTAQILNRAGRILCDGVVNSTVAVTVDGCALSLSVCERGARSAVTRSVTTFVAFRN